MFSKGWGVASLNSRKPKNWKSQKLKKRNPRVGVLDEEVEEWDEKDKVDYEINKQFKKLTVETVAMKEKMEKMQLTFRKAQGMDDYLYNMGGMSSKNAIALPRLEIFGEKWRGENTLDGQTTRSLGLPAKLRVV